MRGSTHEATAQHRSPSAVRNSRRCEVQCGTPGSVSSMQSPTAQAWDPFSHRDNRTHHGGEGPSPGEGKAVAAPMASTCAPASPEGNGSGRWRPNFSREVFSQVRRAKAGRWRCPGTTRGAAAESLFRGGGNRGSRRTAGARPRWRSKRRVPALPAGERVPPRPGRARDVRPMLAAAHGDRRAIGWGASGEGHRCPAVPPTASDRARGGERPPPRAAHRRRRGR